MMQGNLPQTNSSGSTWSPQVGHHLSLPATGASRSLLQEAVDNSPTIVQVYLPQRLPSQAFLSPSKPFFVHTALTINLGQEDPSSRSYLRLAAELQAVELCDCSCVVHIGRGKGCSLETVIQQVNLLVSEMGLRFRPERKCPFPLLLENAAGQGYELGRSWDELRKIKEGLDTSAVGFCFDTQHAFGAGIADFQSTNTIDNVFAWGEYLSPGQNWGCIHLNDSKVSFGSRKDRHAPLGSGQIWSGNNLAYFVQKATDAHIPLITETSDPLGDYSFLLESCRQWKK